MLRGQRPFFWLLLFFCAALMLQPSMLFAGDESREFCIESVRQSSVDVFRFQSSGVSFEEYQNLKEEFENIIERLRNRLNLKITITNFPKFQFSQFMFAGSGVVIREPGRMFFLSAGHLFENRDHNGFVARWRGNFYPIRFIDVDYFDDKALLEIMGVPAEGGAGIRFGNSEKLKRGNEIFVMGTPASGMNIYPQTVSRGVVSNIDVTMTDGYENHGLLAIDAHIYYGNSGGPVFVCNGDVPELVGFSLAIDANLSYALPIQRVLKDLASMKEGIVSHGFLGVKVVPLESISMTEKVKGGISLHTRGLFVESVRGGTPAHKTGIKPKDILVSIDGNPVESFLQALSMVSGLRAGSSATFLFLRDGAERSVEAVLGDRSKIGRKDGEL